MPPDRGHTIICALEFKGLKFLEVLRGRGKFRGFFLLLIGSRRNSTFRDAISKIRCERSPEASRGRDAKRRYTVILNPNLK